MLLAIILVLNIELEITERIRHYLSLPQFIEFGLRDTRAAKYGIHREQDFLPVLLQAFRYFSGALHIVIGILQEEAVAAILQGDELFVEFNFHLPAQDENKSLAMETEFILLDTVNKGESPSV